MSSNPGVYTVFKDSAFTVNNSAVKDTDVVVLLGTATDGPLFVPVKPERPSEAISTFGTYNNLKIGSSMLVPGYNEAYFAGARNVYLMRVAGEDAVLQLKNTAETPVSVIKLAGKYPGAKYNNIHVEVTATELKVWSVNDSLLSKVAPTIVYTLADYALIKDLVAAVNADIAVTDLRAEVVADGEVDLAIAAKAPLTGGDDKTDSDSGDYSTNEDGSNGTGYRAAIEYAYSLLLDFPSDIVVPLGLTVSASDNKDAQKLAEFCYESAGQNNDVVGVIGVAPFVKVDLAGISTGVKAMATANNVYTAEDGTDIGRYVSVILGELQFADNVVKSYVNTPAAAYAGFVSTLGPQNGSTNKVIPGVESMRCSVSPKQAEVLRDNKITVIRNKYGKGITVVDGVLASKPTSDFQSLSTIRSVIYVMDLIRDAVDPFIGNALDRMQYSAMKTAIKDVKKTAIDAGVITDMEFDVYFATDSTVIGDLDVELELEIPAELHRIRCTVTRKVTDIS
jgi:hypothetical protein